MPQPEVEEKEEPLDPAMERIRRKMVLLQLVSGGILFVCFMAVLAAIVYKISQRPADGPATVATSGSFTVPSDQPLAATAALPAGFTIDNVSMSGSQLVFLGQLNGARKVFVFDIVLGRIVADVTIATGQ
jgi:hypothetical protein